MHAQLAREAAREATQLDHWLTRRESSQPTDRGARDAFYYQTGRLLNTLYAPDCRRLLSSLVAAGVLGRSTFDQLELVRLGLAGPGEGPHLVALLRAGAQALEAGEGL